MAAGLISSEAENAKDRLLYIDNLRLLVIVLVVTIHWAVTVSGFGSWYYVYGTHLDTLSTVWFAFYQSFTQGYFLGLLFMISGYFVAGSYDRKGFSGFVGDRFKRLIIPTVIFMIAITPFIEIVELGSKSTRFNLVGFLSGTGPMWFAAALFAFSLIYGLMRLIPRRSATASNWKQLEPTLGFAVSLILIIAVFAFLIRIVQPIGTDTLNFQLCYFASYIVLFIVGIIAYRNSLFAKISYRTGKRWLIGAIALGFLAWFVMVAVATATGTTAALEGGLAWQSAAFSVWETFVAVAMSIGLIAVFKEKFNRQSKFVKTLADNSFAVYMFHPMIIIPVTVLFSPLVLSPVAKWVLLCVICVPLCFAATHFVFRKIPLLKNVL
ncbi:MAG: acyltransferase family protein [Candidatus Bathyarchaeia archaeon]